MSVDPDQIVRLRLPGEISHFCAADGEWLDVVVEGAGRYVWIKAGLVAAMLAQPSSWPLREANESLAAALGPLRQQEPALTLTEHWEAQRKANMPPTRNEIAEVTVAMYRRAMGYDV